jgi:Cof subfamily protein (haloacid dehalogenase superfamily)
MNDDSNAASNIRLIALDLDDTLLRADLTISEKNKGALQRAENLSIHIVLASGRNFYSMKRYADELFIHRRGDYLIGSNGAQLIQASTGKLLENRALPAKLCRQIIEYIEERGYFWQVYVEGKIYCNRINTWSLIDQELSGLPLEIITERETILSSDHTKIVVGGEPEKIETMYAELKKRFGNHMEIVTSKPYFLEILPEGGNKGAALERLTRRLRVDMENVLAIGDGLNDLEMVRRAGWGCAPANAAQEVRASARFVSLKTNNEDAVADILEHFALKNEAKKEARTKTLSNIVAHQEKKDPEDEPQAEK